MDLYAGIGYYTLPFLSEGAIGPSGERGKGRGATHVVACEWNPIALKALRWSLSANGLSDRCTIIEGDNREQEFQAEFDRINLGLLPSSEDGYAIAIQALKPEGGVLHVHGLSSDGNEEEWGANLVQTLEKLGPYSCSVEHIEDVIRNMWTRTLVSTPLLLLLFGSLEFGSPTWGFMVGIFALGAHREYCIAIKLEDRGLRMVSLVVLLALILIAMNPNLAEIEALAWAGPQGAGLLGAALFAGALGIWAVPIVQDRSENVTRDVGQAFIGFILIWFFIHGIFLMHLGAIGVGAFIFAIVNVSMNDSFALIVGRIFGKHPFRPVLSPKKTWERVSGGVTMAAIAGSFPSKFHGVLGVGTSILIGSIVPARRRHPE